MPIEAITAIVSPRFSPWKMVSGGAVSAMPARYRRRFGARVVQRTVGAAQRLNEHEQPPIDDAIVAELDDFVARRTAEGGAAPE